MATHSVRRHLRVEIAAYDAMIRRFTPGYETMLEVIAGALTASGPDHVLDLGAGTGALSEAILAHGGAQTVELIDLDPEMLDLQARERDSGPADGTIPVEARIGLVRLDYGFARQRAEQPWRRARERRRDRGHRCREYL